jgi:glutathione S-transferase
MAGMRFYDLPHSPWCQMVRVVLAEKGLPHERHIVLPGQEDEDWFLGINPLGRVPVLVDRDLVVRDAAVINEYLEEAFPDRTLLPGPPEARAAVRMMVHLAEEFVGAPLDELHQARLVERVEDGALLEDLHDDVLDGLEILEGELDSRSPYAAGDAFTLADAALAPFLLGLLSELGLESVLSRFPNVQGYRDRLARRASTAVVRQGWEEWRDMAASIAP